MDSGSVYRLDLSGENNDNSKGGYGATLDVLVRALLPARLRVGGTQGDYNVYVGFDNSSNNFPIGSTCTHLPHPMTPYRCKEITPADASALLGFVSRNNLTLVWGLNDLFGRPTKLKPEKKMCGKICPPRNTSNYETLLKWLSTDARGKQFANNILAFELGNELNSCLNGEAGAHMQAADFAALRKKMDDAGLQSTLLAGPDTHSAAEFQSDGLAWFSAFAAASQVG